MTRTKKNVNLYLESLEQRQLMCGNACVADRILDGDANNDSKVGFDDFLILSRNFGQSDSPTFSDGDFNQDGKVDFADFLVLSNSFGADAGPVDPPVLDFHPLITKPETGDSTQHGSDNSISQGLARDNAVKWEVGESIIVHFQDGTQAQRQHVQSVVEGPEGWERYANIDFVFDQPFYTPEILITFTDGNWSYLGSVSKSFARRGEPSMSLEAVTDNTAGTSVARRKVLHEFGHALGFVHEHQRSDRPIEWNRDEIWNDMRQSEPTWSDEEVDAFVDEQIIETIAISSTNHSRYDPHSVMHYSIPEDWTIGDFNVLLQTKLSNLDKQLASRVYPFPGKLPVRFGARCGPRNMGKEAFVVNNHLRDANVEVTVHWQQLPSGGFRVGGHPSGSYTKSVHVAGGSERLLGCTWQSFLTGGPTMTYRYVVSSAELWDSFA